VVACGHRWYQILVTGGTLLATLCWQAFISSPPELSTYRPLKRAARMQQVSRSATPDVAIAVDQERFRTGQPWVLGVVDLPEHICSSFYHSSPARSDQIDRFLFQICTLALLRPRSVEPFQSRSCVHKIYPVLPRFDAEARCPTGPAKAGSVKRRFTPHPTGGQAPDDITYQCQFPILVATTAPLSCILSSSHPSPSR
jgi:hypothetical protein